MDESTGDKGFVAEGDRCCCFKIDYEIIVSMIHERQAWHDLLSKIAWVAMLETLVI